MSNVDKFNDFLATIDLQGLREKYRDIKIVELDMPKNVQALACVYQEYWKNKSDWPNYDLFYKRYLESLSTELEEWRKKAMFSKETFYRGLPARIYRTWASILTQIQGAYVAEAIYGEGKVDMGVNLDQKGKDMVIDLGEGYGRMPIQIKKKSQRPEASRKTSPRHKFIKIVYEVPPGERLTRKGEERLPYRRWQEKWKGKLECLDNGFVVFQRDIFEFRNLLAGMIE